MIKKRLVRLLSHARKYVALQVIWQWLALLCQIGVIGGTGRLVQAAYDGSINPSMLWRMAALVAVAIVLRFLFDRLNTRASYAASLDVKRVLREQIYGKLLRLGASYKEKITTAEVVQMSVEGVEQLETYFGRYLSQLFYSLLAPLTLFAVLFPLQHHAAAVLLICVPLIPLSIVVVQKIAKRLLAKYWDAYAQLGDGFLENLQGLTELIIYRADEDKAEEMDDDAEHFRRITMKVLTMQLNSTSVMDIMAYGGAAVGIIVCLVHFIQGDVDLAGTVMICLLAAEFFLPLRILGSFFHIAMNGMAASDRIFAFLDLPEPEQGQGEIEEEKVEIEASGLRYSYDGTRPILSGLDVRFGSGEFVSIVGASGSGKSTIAGILTGRCKGYGGSIRVAGAELSEISEEQLRCAVTLVGTNSYLFKGTVRENLQLANDKASDEAMEAALALVNLRGFLNTQEGLDTKLTEQAANLSGGQRQRLALARALLANSPVYIFDEATSNIDVESEEMIMKVIRELAQTRTVILISHRLANVTGSDRIYMLQGGICSEEGTHEELMQREGAYAKLYRSQKILEAYGRKAS